MYAVGIDVSKDESTVAVIQPFGVVIAEPYKVRHTETDLRKLADYLKSLPGETKVIMEYTGRYYEPIARCLHNEGIFISVVNAILIANYRQKIESAFDGFFIAFAPFFESREYHRNMLHGNVYPWNSLLCITCLFICGRNNIMNNSLQIHCIYFIESIL